MIAGETHHEVVSFYIQELVVFKRSDFIYFGYILSIPKKDMRYLFHLIKKGKNPDKILNRHDLVLTKHPGLCQYIYRRDDIDVITFDFKIDIPFNTRFTVDNRDYLFTKFGVNNVGELTLTLKLVGEWQHIQVPASQLFPHLNQNKKRIVTYE